jgi:hypothetical protein
MLCISGVGEKCASAPLNTKLTLINKPKVLLEDNMFEQADALFIVAELKAVFGRLVLIGLLFLVGKGYIQKFLDNVHRKM